MSDVVLLRTLTEKSTLGFGQYFDMTVFKLIEMQRCQYLRWVYFNCSNVSFCESVLNELKITEEFRILKPGKNNNLYLEIQNKLREDLPDWKKEKIEKRAKNHSKAKTIHSVKSHKAENYKSVLQRKNHGKR
jgi:hypothetical protein